MGNWNHEIMLIELYLKMKLRLSVIRISKPRVMQVFSLKELWQSPNRNVFTHPFNKYLLSTRSQSRGRNLISYVNRENLM